MIKRTEPMPRGRLACITALVLGLSFGQTWGTLCAWTGGSGNWDSDANWNPYAPRISYSDDARIDNGGTATISTAVAGRQCDELQVAYLGGSSGHVVLSGAGALSSRAASIGSRGVGTFTQTGGTHTLWSGGGGLGLGTNETGDGTYTLSGGDLIAQRGITVGECGKGTFNQIGGTNTVTGSPLYIGRSTGGDGTYTLSDGVLDAGSVAIYVGQWGAVAAEFNLNGGTADSHALYLSAAGTVNLRNDCGFSTGYLLLVRGDFNQTGGTATVAGRLEVDSATGSYDLSGSGSSISADSVEISDTGQFSLNGGLLAANSVAIEPTGMFASSGQGTLRINEMSGQGDNFTLNGSLQIGHNGHAGSWAVGAGGGLTVTKDLTVGYDYTAELGQSDGAVDVSGDLVVGHAAGADGTYGLGDGQLSVGVNEYVGRDGGTGTFTQTGGTHEIAGGLYVGDQTGALGAFQLGGTGQLASLHGVVGSTGGEGGFVHSGGTHTLTNILNVGYGVGGVGTYTLSGTGQLSVTAGDECIARAGGTGTFTQTGGTNTVAGAVYVGIDADSVGTYALGPQGQVSVAGSTWVGYDGGTGTLTVDGAGASWVGGGAMLVGSYGTGRLDIAGGAGVSNAYTMVAYGAGSEGAVTVDGSGSTWTHSSYLIVGRDGVGEMSITDGGSVSNTWATVGHSAGAEGTVTVNGPSSSWTNTETLHVGSVGTGTLTVENGADVTSAASYLGYAAGVSGTVTVDGSGSTWQTVSGGYVYTAYVGYCGTGRLDITNRGYVRSWYGYIGVYDGSTGLVDVDGASSYWYVQGDLRVGYGGCGTLNITHAGYLSNFDAHVGFLSGGHGTVTVDGEGSTWSNRGSLTVGADGTGELNITNAATVLVYGDLTIGSAGTVAMGGRLLKAGSLQNTSGGTFNWTGGELSLPDGLGGYPQIPIAPGGNYAGACMLTRRVDPGDSYAGLSGTVDGGQGTTAELLAGTAGTDRNVSMQWRAAVPGEGPDGTDLYSDVLNLTGTGSDVFVLQMGYSEGTFPALGLTEEELFALGRLCLGWRSGALWVEATAGNIGALGTDAVVQFDGSYADLTTWLNANTHSWDMDSILGSWGVDMTANVAWAVVDHSSEFAVPEPATMGLLGFGGIMLMLRRRRK